tara:strand:- start:831 stop:1661 length:831 start_codon:yes stop_codon:yes gene_type:complete
MARRMKYDVEAKEEGKEGEGGFLSRWSDRKNQIAKGGDVPDEGPAPEIAEDSIIEDEEDAALTDAELLEKYDLPDPEVVTEESGLEQFLNGRGLPGRVRQMALRRLWRLNPLFGVVDDMVEYGEDYTDAATVIEGMKTAYTVGKGYAKEVVEPEDTEANEGGDEAEGTDKVEDETDDKVEDKTEDKTEKTQVDQETKTTSDDEVTDGTGETTDNSPSGALHQQVVSAEGVSQDQGAGSAEIPNGLPKIAQTVSDHVAAMPIRRPSRMSFVKPKTEV